MIGTTMDKEPIKPFCSDSNLSVPLREYIERIMHENDKAVRAHLQSTQQAIDKAEKSLNERLAGMNEFRDTLRDQSSRFVTWDILNAKNDSIDTRLKVLEVNRANAEGRIWAIGAVIIFINLMIAVAGFVMKISGGGGTVVP